MQRLHLYYRTPISDTPILQTTLQTRDCGEALEAGHIDDEPNLVPNGRILHYCSIPDAQELHFPTTNADLTVAHAQAEQVPKHDATECTNMGVCDIPLVTDNGAERAATYVADNVATDVLEQTRDEMGSLVLEYRKAESSIPAIIFAERDGFYGDSHRVN